MCLYEVFWRSSLLFFSCHDAKCRHFYFNIQLTCSESFCNKVIATIFICVVLNIIKISVFVQSYTHFPAITFNIYSWYMYIHVQVMYTVPIWFLIQNLWNDFLILKKMNSLSKTRLRSTEHLICNNRRSKSEIRK